MTLFLSLSHKYFYGVKYFKRNSFIEKHFIKKSFFVFLCSFEKNVFPLQFRQPGRALQASMPGEWSRGPRDFNKLVDLNEFVK